MNILNRKVIPLDVQIYEHTIFVDMKVIPLDVQIIEDTK